MMNVADPERALVTAYAPATVRAPLALLWRLDERLGRVVAAARDPQLGVIRLVWWREALKRLDTAPAPEEPLLAAVAAELLPRGLTGAALAELTEGWAALLDPLGDDAIARHAAERGGRLFVLAGTLLGTVPPQLAAAGAGWSLVDLAFHLSDAEAAARALAMARTRLAEVAGWRWPGRLRALGALTVLAAGDARQGRDEPREPGSPRRLARALAHRITGR